MKKHCNDCARYGADDCPNSKECYSTEDKPYFTKKAMKPIYIFGRRRIRELEKQNAELWASLGMTQKSRDEARKEADYNKKVNEILFEKCEEYDFNLVNARKLISELESDIAELKKFAPNRDSKGRFTKRK